MMRASQVRRMTVPVRPAGRTVRSGALPDKAPEGLDCPFSHCELRQALASPVDCALFFPCIIKQRKIRENMHRGFRGEKRRKLTEKQRKSGRGVRCQS